MVIFNSYVKLSEGTSPLYPHEFLSASNFPANAMACGLHGPKPGAMASVSENLRIWDPEILVSLYNNIYIYNYIYIILYNTIILYIYTIIYIYILYYTIL